MGGNAEEREERTAEVMPSGEGVRRAPEKGLIFDRSRSSSTHGSEFTGEISYEVCGHEFKMKPAGSVCDFSLVTFSCIALDTG